MSPAPLSLPRDARLAAATRAVLDRVGDKWSVLIVALLGDGSRRFSELRRGIGGISQRMLTLTLRGLERDGLVMRTARGPAPPRVDYALTALGRAWLVPVRALGTWAEGHAAELQAARGRFDLRRPAGAARSPE